MVRINNWVNGRYSLIIRGKSRFKGYLNKIKKVIKIKNYNEGYLVYNF